MLRQLAGSLALTALLAVPVNAQFQADVSPDIPAPPHAFDQYAATITGGGYTGDWFQVFCVNPTLVISDNDPAFQDAWITPMSSANGTYVINPNGNVWLGNYVQAARLASLMGATGGVDAAVHNLQFAIWEAMGWTFNAGNIASYGSSAITTAFANYDASAIASYVALAAIIPNFSTNQWLVITPQNKNRQELIFNDPDRPFETVPEPATMTLLATGLAGMAAARRRNKKS